MNLIEGVTCLISGISYRVFLLSIGYEERIIKRKKYVHLSTYLCYVLSLVYWKKTLRIWCLYEYYGQARIYFCIKTLDQSNI